MILGIDFLYLFLIHLAEVPGKNHPFLDLLGIAHGFPVSRVNAFLESSHHVGIRTIDDVFHSVCIASNRPAPVQSCGGQLAGGLHGVGVHLDREGEEGA